MTHPLRAHETLRSEVGHGRALGAAENAVDNEDIVNRIRAGDRTAFDELVRAYCDPLCSYVTGIVGSAAAAEELVQDVFWKIWRMRGDWEIRSNVRSYLFSAARKIALNDARRTRLGQRWETAVVARNEAALMGSMGEAADLRVEALEFRAVLRRAIEELPPRCREAASLRFEHDLSCSEIARVMGVTLKAAERQSAKAARTVRAALAAYLNR